MHVGSLILIAALQLGQPAPAPAYALQMTPVQRVEAVLVVNVTFPDGVVSEWEVLAPRLPELPGQRKVSSVLDVGGKPGKELSELERPILSALVSAKEKGFEKGLKFRLTYQADMFSRQLVPLRPGAKAAPVKNLSPLERKFALAESDVLNFEDKVFQGWLDDRGLRRRKKENEVDYARRLFLSIHKDFTYQYTGSMNRQPANVCKVGKSDCVGLGLLYVAALRANDVPARMLVGRWAIPGEKSKDTKVDQVIFKDYGGQHASTEFFARGVGWIPADPSSGIVHDKSKTGLDFFGRDTGTFLVLHVDTGMAYESAHYGRQAMDWMQSPIVWTSGVGANDNRTVRETWEVRKLR